ncbi:ribosomal large subunit pseudouridine synthase B [Mycoplasmopsis californica]|uniref:Pseudouridine synthase n=1 Tax=Mycoplasmopsis equigenitalium TaxID=114883 RepID=A0ABY5J1C4_9BACT|nr:pseudouridine synthase [Mycoplasmopsis equigenitalium]UUD37062.1 rRNA pseudouridine synthase [Mycoplasmopsis equigenitalium]VEU69638.1 ribosomal large subunit pseudouridine synthase B [Mycoplasmopsis californica]
MKNITKNELKVRVQKIIAESGLCSRRKAEELITQGSVTINGKIAKLGDLASYQDIVLVNKKRIFLEEKEYFLLNKPKHTICSNDDKQNRKKVIDLIPSTKRLYTVGRLDYDTTGAIIITNDGELCHKLSHPSFEIERVYNVEINTPLTSKEMILINKEMVINDKPSFHEVKHLNLNFYQIKLHQGSNHHVKKVFESLGKEVINLHRLSYSFLNVDHLQLGKFRLLKPFEIKKLKFLAKKS